MKHKTNQTLIEKQIEFWNEDFFDPSNPVKISQTPETISISEITINQAVMDMYQDEENKNKIKEMQSAIESGTSLPPLLTDKYFHLIDGYHRLLALKNLGETNALVIRLNKRFNDTDNPIY